MRRCVRRTAIGAVWFLVTLSLAGCAAERSVLTTDAGLSYQSLHDGGIAIVGVTVVQEVEQVRPPLNSTLQAVLREAYPELPLRSPDEMRDTLGLAEHRRILSAFQLDGRLGDADRGILATRLRRSARYALLARVDKDAIHLPPVRAPLYGNAGAANPQFGTRAARRDARVRVTLYDLEMNKEAWAAVYASSSDNVLPDSTARLPDVLLVPPPGLPTEQPLEPVPDSPSLARALIEGFRAFAADLPAPPGPPAAATPQRR